MALDLDDPYQFAVVINTSDDRDYVLSFPIPGDKRANIPAGERKMFPFDTIASAFGHPRARNLSHKDRSRDEEYRFKRIYWGFHEGFDVEREADKTDVHRINGTSSWEVKCPKFRVETLEGEWIPMVLDDPLGEHPLPEDNGAVDADTARASGSAAVMERALLAMAERDKERDAVIAALLEKIENLGGSTTDVETAQKVPSDFSGGNVEPAPTSSQLPEPPTDEKPPKVDRPRGTRVRPSDSE